ncbi:MAG: EAL domain-containing protein [Actinomycetota bacterium]
MFPGPNTRDQLTGLAGRLDIARLLDSGQSGDDAFGVGAVLFVDLDRFKWINDSMGHHVGDEVLRTVARRLERQVRAGDVAARFGGDEFVVVMASIKSVTETTKVAKRIVESLSQPMQIGDVQVGVGASVGIAIAQHQSDTSDLLRQADTALYEAKRRGRGRHVIFDHRLAARAEHRVKVESAIRSAILDDQLTVNYQPIVDLASGRIVAYEGLARLSNPEVGPISPAEFIPLACEIGEIVEVGRHLRQLLITDLAQVLQHQPEMVFAVNLASAELGQPDLAERISAECEALSLPPRHLSIELSEDLLVRDQRRLHRTLNDLRHLGARISLDDFGTGQASLTSLRGIEVDEIKIDGSFVSGVVENPFDRATCEAIRILADAMGATVVAEGIESPEEVDVLRAIGVEYGQGYYFAKPAAIDWSDTDNLATNVELGTNRELR